MPSRVFSYASSGSTGLSDSVTVTGSVTELEEVIAASASDVAVSIAIDYSAMTGLYIVADAAMTLETNSGSSPDDTFALVANQPIVWTNVSQLASPLTEDVTAIYVTSTPGGTLKIQVIQDATP